jgi:hypothetical protein
MASYRNQNLCFYCKRFNHRQEDCRTRIQDGQLCTDTRGRKYWPKRYTDEETTQGPMSPISALTNYVTPLMGSRSVLTQIILNLCLASLTTCSKIYDIFAPGEKIRPRVNIRTGNQTTSWLFDTGAAITCTNSRSFNAAFGNQKPKKIANAQSCVAASGDAMNSIGGYEIDLYIKGQKFTHPVNVINELNDNIIGIDFMHRNKLIYDVNTRQVKFADEKMNTICATKQITIPAMTSSIITMKQSAPIKCVRRPTMSQPCKSNLATPSRSSPDATCGPWTMSYRPTNRKRSRLQSRPWIGPEKSPTCSTTRTRTPYTRQCKDSATATTASSLPPFCWNNWTNWINEARTENKTPTGPSHHWPQ